MTKTSKVVNHLPLLSNSHQTLINVTTIKLWEWLISTEMEKLKKHQKLKITLFL